MKNTRNVSELSADYVEMRLDNIDDSLREISLFFKMLRREHENHNKCKEEAQDAMLNLMKAMVSNGVADEDGKCCKH